MNVKKMYKIATYKTELDILNRNFVHLLSLYFILDLIMKESIMKERKYIGKLIDEENGVYLCIERIGEVVGVSLSTRIDDSLVCSGKKLLNEFIIIDPEIYDDTYEIKKNNFIYTLYIDEYCGHDKFVIFEIVKNHFYGLLKSIKKSKSKDLKELCFDIYKDMYISDCILMIENGLE